MYKSSQYNKFFFDKDAIFLFNSYSKACVQVEKKEIEKIKAILRKKEPCKGKDKVYQDALIENRFIIPESINEIDNLDYEYNENYFQTDLMNIAILTTSPGGKKVTNREIKDYFKVLRDFAEKNFSHKKRVHMNLFMQDHLLKKDEVFSYLDCLFTSSEKYGYKVTLNIMTNGQTLDIKTIKTLLKYNIKSLGVSLDGTRKTYDTALNNFKLAVRYGIQTHSNVRFTLRVNIVNQTIEDMRSMFNLFDAEERKRIRIVFRQKYKIEYFCNFKKYDLNKFDNEARKHGFDVINKSNFSLQHLQYCESDGGVNNFFFVTPDLKIWKCINNMSIEAANIGFIDKTGTIQLNPNMAKWYQSTSPFKDEKCRGCYYLPLCFGGCPLYRVKTGKRQCTPKEIVKNILPR
jgi:uncharacterized protein